MYISLLLEASQLMMVFHVGSFSFGLHFARQAQHFTKQISTETVKQPKYLQSVLLYPVAAFRSGLSVP